MCWTNIDSIDTDCCSRACTIATDSDWIEETTLLEIEPVYFVSGGGDVCIAGWKMICDGPAELGYPCSIVCAGLRVKLYGSIGLEMY